MKLNLKLVTVLDDGETFSGLRATHVLAFTEKDLRSSELPDTARLAFCLHNPKDLRNLADLIEGQS